MARLNRTVAYVAAILLIAVGLAYGIGQLALPGPYTLTASSGEQFTFTKLSPIDELVNGALALVVVLLGVLLLAAELLGPPWVTRLQVKTAAGGAATVTKTMVETRLKDVLQSVPGVSDAKPSVHVHRSKVNVDAVLHVANGTSVAGVSEAALAIVRHTLGEELGQTPGEISVTVESTTLPRRPSPAS
jgi:uncharacterized alkaline shock family protein YloU